MRHGHYVETRLSGVRVPVTPCRNDNTRHAGRSIEEDITNFFIDEIEISTGTDCTDNWGIKLTPSVLNFGFVEPGQSATRTVSVINSGASTLVGTATARESRFLFVDPFTSVAFPRFVFRNS